MKIRVKYFFKKKFEKDQWAAPKLDGISFSQLSWADNELLTASFDMEEKKK